MQNSAVIIRIALLGTFLSLLFGISKPGLANPDGVLEAITLSPNFTPNPVQQNGVSGGAKAAATVVNTAQTPTGPCNGFISEQPDHVLRLNAFFQDLEIQVASQRDTTLVIQGTGGTWCNDDASDHNPRIAGQWQAGTYNVWVGSFRQEEYYPYRLIIRQTD